MPGLLESLWKRRSSSGGRRPVSRPRTRSLRFQGLEQRLAFTTFPFTIINNTIANASTSALAFQDNQINVAIYTKDWASTATWYYFDSSGTAHTTLSITPVQNVRSIPTFPLSNLTPNGGHSYTINLPDTLPTYPSQGLNAARVYLMMNSTPELTVNKDGSVNALTPGNDTNNFFDFFEFSLNTPNNPVDNINIDTSDVDQWGFPIQVQVAPTGIGNPPEGVGVRTARADVIGQFQDFVNIPANSAFTVCLGPDSGTFGPYRITNPSDVIDAFGTANANMRVQTSLNAKAISGATSIQVYSPNAFPTNPSTANPFTVTIGTSEQLTVVGLTYNTDHTGNWTLLNPIQGTYNSGTLINMGPPAMSATAATLTTAQANGYPLTYPFNVLVDSEIMTVTGLASANLDGTVTWNVTRGAFGTTATAHYNNQSLIYYNDVTSSPLNSYFNQAIDDLFTLYWNTNNKLSIQSKASGTALIYTGTVTTDALGNYVLQFKDPVTAGVTYDVYYPFFNDNKYYWAGYTPKLPVGNAPDSEKKTNVQGQSPSSMVFGASGVFGDSANRTKHTATQKKVLGDLENQIVAALNRGVAQLPAYTASAIGTWADPNMYYGNNNTGEAWNKYAQFLHQTGVSIDGKAYAFAYDDQGSMASDIAVASFTSVTVTLGNWVETIPVVPSPITITQVGSTALNLAWQEYSTNVTGFTIYRYNGSSYVQIGSVAGNVLSYQDTGLQANTYYYYAIRATNQYGSIDGWATGVTASGVAPPTNLSATPVGNTQLQLSWQESTPAVTQFIVYRFNGMQYVPIATLGATTTSYLDSGLQPNTKYLYCIRALVTPSQYADGWVSGTTAPSLAVSPPRISATAVGSNELDLSWQAGGSPVAFALFRFNGSQYTQVAMLAATARSYQDKNLQANSLYYYAIRAIASDGSYIDGWIAAKTGA